MDNLTPLPVVQHPGIEIWNTHSGWIKCLKYFHSADVYMKRVNHFLEYHLDSGNDSDDLITSLEEYFDKAYMECGPCTETLKYSGTTLRSWYSMFKMFLQKPDEAIWTN